MGNQSQTYWVGCVRILAFILVAMILGSLFLSLFPGALEEVILLFPIPGNVRIPFVRPTLLAPNLSELQGQIPDGFRALKGIANGTSFSCGFLLDLGDGQRVGVNTAHSIVNKGSSITGEFRAPDGSLAAVLTGQIGYGQTFVYDQFTLDYVLWSVGPRINEQRVLQPDPRGQAQPGEPIMLYSPSVGPLGEPQTFQGVVMSVSAVNTWIQLDESFSPSGFSGCPVISLVTGKVIGMAVAGANKPPVVLGLHPIGSLVEKAQAALSSK